VLTVVSFPLITSLCKYIERLYIAGIDSPILDRTSADARLFVTAHLAQARSWPIIALTHLIYFTRDFCNYPGGYVDGKIVDLAFLREVAKKGSEPARAAFAGTWCAYSRLPEIDELVQRIPTYRETERQERIRSFYGQFQAWHWYLPADILTLMDQALAQPSAKTIEAFGKSILDFTSWDTPLKGWPARFMEDTEWAWRRGCAAVEDW
jgi:hypothetical protein